MYNKIFTKILDSSIWLEPDATRIVWLTCIAAMDEDGFCQFASAANLAHRAHVPLESCEMALVALEGPDANSSDPEFGGRRLERVPGGWMVLNAEKYRGMVTRAVAQERTKERVRRFRERNAPKRSGNAKKRRVNGRVTPSETVSETESEARSESETKITVAASGDFDRFWSAYPKRVGKDDARKAWKAKHPDLQTVLAALDRQSAYLRRDGGKFIPNPATWLNQGRWQDDPPADTHVPIRTDAPRFIPWSCPHTPTCSSRWPCERKQQAEAS